MGSCLVIACLTLGFWFSNAASAVADGFVLCPSSAEASQGDRCGDYFVGYGRQGHLEIAGQTGDWPTPSGRIYPSVADAQAQATPPEEAALRLETNMGEAIAQLQFDDIRVGAVDQHQTLRLPSLTNDIGKIQTQTELIWGDTLHVTSKRLPNDSPVALRVEREILGSPSATEDASTRLTLQTWVDGRLVPKLKYQLAKFPGPGEQEREQGLAKTSVSVVVKVGGTVHIESRLQIDNGMVASKAAQQLEGNRSVVYHVDLLSDDSCARSESGLLTTGDCL